MPRKNRPADGQLRLIDKSYEQQVQESAEVECLEMTFASDEEHPEYRVVDLAPFPFRFS